MSELWQRVLIGWDELLTANRDGRRTGEGRREKEEGRREKGN